MSDYKLTYFNARGRAEFVRLIFAAAGQKFTDERISDWPKGKEDSPLGQLPYLTISGTKLPQSIAIARFAAKKANLYGSNELEQAKTDAVVDTVSDFRTALYTKVFAAKETEREATKKAFLSDEAAAHFEKIEKLIKLWGSNGYSVGSSLKWSDLAIWNFTSELKATDANVLSKYPGVVAVNKSVESHPKIAEYIKNRPVTPF